MGRDTFATIDLSKVSQNYKLLEGLSKTKVFGVVKANAYGHGSIELAKHLEALGTPFLCVSSIDEALELIENGIQNDILIFSYVSKQDIIKYHHENFAYTVTSKDWYESIKDLPMTLRLHVEINTGMNRYGIKESDINDLFQGHHIIEGVYTHFNAPSINASTLKQMEEFKKLVTKLEQDVKWIHCGNAPMEFMADNSWINGGRFGLGLYGYRLDCPQLQPVLNLTTKINHIDVLKAGDTLGYDATYTAHDDGIFAAIPIGYGDGFDLRNNTTSVYINDKAYPIVGKVCMDQTMLLIDSDVKFEDSVEIIGPHRTCFMIEKETGMSVYIQLTGLSHRLKRIYI